MGRPHLLECLGGDSHIEWRAKERDEAFEESRGACEGDEEVLGWFERREERHGQGEGEDTQSYEGHEWVGSGDGGAGCFGSGWVRVGAVEVGEARDAITEDEGGGDDLQSGQP